MEGTIEFLFDSSGAVVAFRHGRDVFDLDLGWLGWAPWNDGDVFDPTGRYLGTITPEGRLYEIDVRCGLTSPPPRTPTIGSHPDPPRGRAREQLGAAMRDVRPRLRVRPHQLTDSGAGDGDTAPVSDLGRRGLSAGSTGRSANPAAAIDASSSGLGVSVGPEAGLAGGLPPIEPQAHPGPSPRRRGRRRVGRPG